MNLKASKILLILALLSMIYFPGNTTAGTSGDYIIFRAQIAEMYIENSTAPIRVRAIYYAANNIPQSVDIEIPYTVTGPDYNLQSSVTIRSGQDAVINLPPMAKGHYHIDIHAEAKGISSEPLRQDFAVSPAPIPYQLSLSPDGRHLFFISKQLNETAQPDPNFPFTIEIYSYRLHMGETLVTKYSNITKLDMDVPAEYRHGIITIDVIDRWGWRNGNSVDIGNSIFTGYPLQYDYDYELREPYKSRTPMYFLSAMIAIGIGYVIALSIKRRYDDV